MSENRRRELIDGMGGDVVNAERPTESLTEKSARLHGESPLITDHWFREEPVRPDGSDGYWICDRCGQHRGDHLQAEGHWLLPLHTFTPQRIRPSHCKPCGRERRHTTHTPWLWEQLEDVT